MRFWRQWGYTGLGYYQYHKPYRECHGARSLPGNLLAKLCNDRDFLYYADCGSVKNLVHEEYRERLNYAKNALSAPNCHNPLFGFCGQPGLTVMAAVQILSFRSVRPLLAPRGKMDYFDQRLA